MRQISFAKALNEALRSEMRRDKTIYLCGTDVGLLQGAFGVTENLLEEFGSERVRDTPISETAIVGTSIGAAATGMRPIPEVGFTDFMGVCGDELLNQMSKTRYMFGGKVKLPIVLRTNCGGGLRAGPHHSQCLEALYMHIPGLKIALPSTPYDAKGLLITAIRDDNPVLFFEHKMLYSIEAPVPEEDYTIPFGIADIKREGKDVTLVATMYMVHKALKAAEDLSKQGIEVEVIDPRTLIPLDKKAILISVKKTSRLVVVEESWKTGGMGAEIAALVAEEAFDFLDAPIKRVAAADVPIPFSPPLEDFVLPDESRIIEAVKDIC